MEKYPITETRAVETEDGRRRLDQQIIFTSERSAHFYHALTRFDVVPKPNEPSIVIVIKETPIPGRGLPARPEK